jgi:hypothetical protein
LEVSRRCSVSTTSLEQTTRAAHPPSSARNVRR